MARMLFDHDHFHEFAARYTAAWCSHDPNRVAAFFAHEGSLSINGGAPAFGRAAIAEAARAYMTAFPDLLLALDRILVQQGCVEYHWTLTGTNTGPGGTGKRIHISGHEIWHLGADELITTSLGYYDAAEYRRQLEQGYQDPASA
ncbi:MAG TPA: nuclear transport factor 2 family protein [Terracidiphilus sp.]